MNRVKRPKTKGMRPRVWIPAALVIVLALGITLGTLGFLGSGSRGVSVPAAVAPLPATPRAAASPGVSPSPGPALTGDPPRVAAGGGVVAAAAPRRGGDAETAASAPSSQRGTASASEPKDPELPRQLYVAESDAARRAIGLGLVRPEQLDAADPGGSASAASARGKSSGSSAELRTASDAFLEEYLLRKQFQEVSFPEGFPAEKDMRSAVQYRMGNLSPQGRLMLLNEALKEMDSLPKQPRFQSVPTASTSPSGG